MFKKVLFLLLFVGIFGVNFAQIKIDYENPKDYIIEKITVSGIKFFNAGTLISISELSVNQKISIPGSEITDAVKKLWKQKMFSDVNISVTKIDGDKITLDIFLQERPRLSKVNFFGIKKSAQDDIYEELDLQRGTQITDDIIKKTNNIIKNHYAEKGFSKVMVKTYKKIDTSFQNAVFLNIYINKFKKTRIEEIIIEGNTVFKKRKIKSRKIKETKERRWWGLFKPSKYIKSKYEDDKKNLIYEYNKEGYRDAKIAVDSVYDFDKKNVIVYIKIDEGKQYFFRNIKWIGNKKYKTEVLQKMLGINRGDVYDKEHLQNRLNIDEDAVGNLYMDNGYLFFNITPVEMKIENDSVDIELRLYEGDKARINKIIIRGNDRTNDNVIRREIRTRPGALFSKSDIIRSVRELAQLGHFDPEQIAPVPIPNRSNGTVDIEYSLVERGNDRVEISGGWGRGTFVGSLGFSFNNFSVHNIFEKSSWRPLPTGDGQSLSIRAQSSGSGYQNYSISFVEPWLGGKKPNSLTVSLYFNRMSRYSYLTSSENDDNAKIIGTAFGFGRRLKWPDDYFTSYFELGYRLYILNNYGYLISNKISSGEFNNLTMKAIFGRNSVDNPLYSRNGSLFSIGVELTPPYSLLNNKNYSTTNLEEKYKWIEYHKWTFKASWFSQLVGDLVLSTKMETGILSFYNEDVGYSPLGGYSVGGDGMGYYTYGTDIIGLRGYTNGSITPSEGGNIYTKYTMEIRYPAVLSQTATIYGLLFAEAGKSWYEFDKFNPFDMYRTGGVGVRIFLPMLGMLGFDWGYGFDKLPGAADISGSQFHFTMGQQF